MEEYYQFGKEEYDSIGAIVRRELAGKTISKSKALASMTGGVMYEAEKLKVHWVDLLRCLEYMCYKGEAAEIDDSIYRVN